MSFADFRTSRWLEKGKNWKKNLSNFYNCWSFSGDEKGPMTNNTSQKKEEEEKETFRFHPISREERKNFKVAWKDSIEHAMWQRNRMMIRKRGKKSTFWYWFNFLSLRCYYASLSLPSATNWKLYSWFGESGWRNLYKNYKLEKCLQGWESLKFKNF